MALFGAGVEYALHTMVNVSLAAPGSPSARELAEFQKLPLAFTRRLLTQLDKAGLVRSAEGVDGGWRLARDSRTITVLDVSVAVQGHTKVFDCRDVRTRCALWPDNAAPRVATSGICAIHAVMQAAEAAMRAELSATSIADLSQRLEAKSSPTAIRAVPLWFSERRATRRAGADA